MFLKSITRTASILTLALGAAIVADAQTYRLPGAHTDQHRELIAGQVNIGKQIKVEMTNKYIEDLFENENEPELDIFTEGWNSKAVNPYAGMEVPDRRDINVSDYAIPVPGRLTSPYGWRKRFGRMHKGVDLSLNVGDTVYAAFDGRVRLTNFERKGYGNYVILRHPNDLETVYGHLSKFLVERDQYVKAGEPIALGGNTGRSTGPHLHFETRFMGYAINPEAIFDFTNKTVHTDVYTFTKSTYQNARKYGPVGPVDPSLVANNDNENDNQPAIQVAQSTSKSKGKASYTVKNGDTLSRIASRNGISMRQLCKLNGLSTSSTIKAGQKLRLR